MIKKVIRSYLINAVALWFVSVNISGFQLQNGYQSLLLVALGFTVLHAFLKPLLELFLGALNFLTLGLIGLVVDSAILYALSVYLPKLRFSDWDFPGLTLNGLTLTPYHFPQLLVIVISALIINLIRSTLHALSD